MTTISIVLTILAALWRVIDGRGIGPTWARNVAGLAIAMACAVSNRPLVFDITLAAMSGCAVLAWLTMIAGYTKWESWWSVARYGGPSCVIAAIGYLAGAGIVPCVVYAAGGGLVSVAYVILHRYLPFKYSTLTSEAVAGAVIVGGLAWL